MNVLVIGDSCKDEFIYGECSRICPEAPVPVFNPIETKINRGMAANVYDNLQSLAKGSINLTLITNHEDIIKTRYVDRKTNQMLLRVDRNDNCKRVTQEMYLPDYDAVVISDYNKGFLNEEDIAYLIERYPISFIDTKKQIGDWIKGINYIKINEPEYLKNKKFLEAGDYIYKSELIVTLGERGVRHQGSLYPPSRKVEALDLSGAGDTFLAGLVFRYMHSGDIYEGINFAQECAGKVIEKKGVTII